ncbi:MAG: ribonuclease P protein component [Candidatus Wolfebacteria bacterium]|nr:ribonuclease P protein component [Candidatus Wolfebacteria bacterium]
MLVKKFRLPVKEFLSKKPKSAKTSNFYFRYLPNQLSFDRAGVVISKKTEKSSARRNRIKRIIFEYFRQEKSKEKNQEKSKEKNIFKTGVDILISPAAKIFKLEAKEIIKIISKEIILIK